MLEVFFRSNVDPTRAWHLENSKVSEQSVGNDGDGWFAATDYYIQAIGLSSAKFQHKGPCWWYSSHIRFDS